MLGRIIPLAAQKMLDSGSWLLYVWADSSPQLSYNFFLTTMLAIREDSLCGAATIANKLALTPYTADLSDEEVEPVLKARAGMVKGLGDMITIINNMPQCLALGGSALAHKVRCLLHVFWMMSGPCPRMDRLMVLAQSVVSFTTDLGVESGMADAVSPSIKAALPPWIFPAAHGARVLPASDDEDGEQDKNQRSFLSI